MYLIIGIDYWYVDTIYIISLIDYRIDSPIYKHSLHSRALNVITYWSINSYIVVNQLFQLFTTVTFHIGYNLKPLKRMHDQYRNVSNNFGFTELHHFHWNMATVPIIDIYGHVEQYK